MHGDHRHHPEPDPDHRGPAGVGDTGAAEAADADRALAAAFIDGFRAARDKQAFLVLAGIPAAVERDGERLHLVEVRIDDRFVVGQVSRGFATADLIHQPLPAAMVAAEADVHLVYVGPRQRLALPPAAVRGMRAAG